MPVKSMSNWSVVHWRLDQRAPATLYSGDEHVARRIFLRTQDPLMGGRLELLDTRCVQRASYGQHPLRDDSCKGHQVLSPQVVVRQPESCQPSGDQLESLQSAKVASSSGSSPVSHEARKLIKAEPDTAPSPATVPAEANEIEAEPLSAPADEVTSPVQAKSSPAEPETAPKPVKVPAAKKSKVAAP